MRFLRPLLGFPLESSHKFRLVGRTHRVGPSGVKALRLAVEILTFTEANRSLLPLRTKIRAVRMTNCKAALTHLVEATPDPRLRRIAIWLRGQCGGYIGTEVLAQFAGDDDHRIRAAVAKSLQRMSAWTLLRDISCGDSSERVRRLASPRVSRDFSTRLHQYTERVLPIPIPPHNRFLYLSPLLNLYNPIRIKSTELIRMFLERIREMVRGGNSLPLHETL